MAEQRLGEVFDEVAEDYDEFRQGYPAEIVDTAIERGHLAPGARALEVGCGTGKLTEALVARGLRVDAVDPAPRMIELARRRVGDSVNVTFYVGRFEEVALPDEAFDALFAATAFHWLDSRVSWRKAASHLKSGALLALLTHTSVPHEQSREVDEGFRALLNQYAPAVAWQPPRDLGTLLTGARERSSNASEVWDWIMGDGRHHLASKEAAGFFEAVQITAHETDVELTADELISHFRTTSLYFQIDPADREAFEDDDRRRIDAAGGTVRFLSATVLMTATRSRPQ
jgi:SAM-dependent methyltransferase